MACYLLAVVARGLLDEVDEIWWAELSQSYQRLCPSIDSLMEDLLCESLQFQVVSIAAADEIQSRGGKVSLRHCRCYHGDGGGKLPCDKLPTTKQGVEESCDKSNCRRLKSPIGG